MTFLGAVKESVIDISLQENFGRDIIECSYAPVAQPDRATAF